MAELPRTVGIEEEFLVVDPSTWIPLAVANAVLTVADDDADLTAELQLEQLETGTTPVRDLADLGAQVRRSRGAAVDAARRVGAAIAAVATSPLPAEPTLTPQPRYRAMAERFGLTTAEALTGGCHVHVGIADPAEGVVALDGIRPWLAPLLALSANSPFFNGKDSGYASFRSQMWWRWPSAGPTELFGSAQVYQRLVGQMVDSATVLDDGMVYFDARLSRHHPTVEIRVADVCRDSDTAVLVAGLVRGLVDTAVAEHADGRAPDPVRTEVLRMASWRAGRSGLDDVLLDPRTWLPAPAADVLRALLEHVTPALEDSGDRDLVADLLAAQVRRGTGATRQRAVFARTGELRTVVEDARLTGDGEVWTAD